MITSANEENGDREQIRITLGYYQRFLALSVRTASCFGERPSTQVIFTNPSTEWTLEYPRVHCINCTAHQLNGALEYTETVLFTVTASTITISMISRCAISPQKCV